MLLRICLITLFTALNSHLFAQAYLEKGLSNNLEDRRSPSEGSFTDNDDMREEMLRQHEEDCNNDCDND